MGFARLVSVGIGWFAEQVVVYVTDCNYLILKWKRFVMLFIPV